LQLGEREKKKESFGRPDSSGRSGTTTLSLRGRENLLFSIAHEMGGPSVAVVVRGKIKNEQRFFHSTIEDCYSKVTAV